MPKLELEPLNPFTPLIYWQYDEPAETQISVVEAYKFPQFVQAGLFEVRPKRRQ